MVISLTGANSHLVKQRLDKLVADFVKKFGGLALERIDAEESDFRAVLDVVQGVPFLSERKMVVVRGLSNLKPSKEQTEQIISSIPESTDLIIYEPLTDKRTTFYNTLKSKTQFEEYENLDGVELSKWLVASAKEIGGELSLADARFMIERVGTNQALLASELEKLVLYSPKISRLSIELLVEPTPQSKIFDLLDAAFSGNKERALNLYDDQRAQKVEPQAILAMLAWQLRLLALAKHGQGKSSVQIAKEAGLSPYPVGKAQGLASKISAESLSQMVDEALDIDVRGKTTSLDMDEALRTYITTL
jgi:DNA polymerase III subunit delta